MYKNYWKRNNKKQKTSVKDRLGPISYDDGPSFYDDDETYQPEHQQRPSGRIKDRLGNKNPSSTVSNSNQMVIFDNRSLAGHSEFNVSESPRQSGGIKNRLGYAKIQPSLPSTDNDLRLIIANRDNNGNIKTRIQLNSFGQRSSNVKERISQPSNGNVPKLNEIYGNVAPYGNYLHIDW